MTTSAKPGGSGGASPQKGYVKVCALEEIPADGALGVEVDDTPIAVVRSGADVYAVNDICSHAEVSLSEGEVYDGTIECWLHGSCFDLRSGKPTNPPATQPVATYKVKVEGGDVYLSLGDD
ncbi:non-heme iron oxygenase ferredoxin subunit [Actinomadura sp. BRA 177]|uniref:non-heme iron oxygenase ferredoxin subunit n=1 Tax=Actinomadura sp. BRA 177 TaxID=2745202 RepID=UPI0015962428|nr:non-heme iron oxygenase ferredoxin subunit [Actinomadura sp. BRA 177]NVI92574.1 non-heme iron oxygenase ferredoxin subunit [Actinomadura sp. BRA 177]